jgi:hypothetical protein
MKQKLKLYLGFFKVALLCLIYYNCQDYDKDEHFMSHQHSKNPYEISFDDFKNETRINNVKKFVSSKFQAASTKSLNDSLFYDFDDFHFFEAPIYSFTGDNGNTSYSFYLEEINQTNDYQIYNLVINKDDNNDWETNIYRLTEDIDDTNLETYSTIEHILSSNGLPAFMKGWEGQWVEQTEYHCVGCVGECDSCSDCKTTTWLYTLVYTIDAGDSSGSGSSGSSSGDTSGGGGDGSQKGFATVTDPCDSSSTGFQDSSGCGGLNDDDQNQQDDSDLDCSYINSLLLNDDFKLLIQNLNTNANLSLNYEKGFQLNFDTNDNLTASPIDGNPNSTSIQVNINQSGNTIGFIHTHYNGLVPNFSIEDIRTFDAIFAERVENNKTLNELTMILISSSGVYAVLIDDYNKLLTEGGNLHTNEFNKIGGIKYKYDNVFRKPMSAEKVERLMVDNANTLNKFGLSLMKAKSDLSGWRKVIPDPNNSNKTKYEDCNSK